MSKLNGSFTKRNQSTPVDTGKVMSEKNGVRDLREFIQWTQVIMSLTDFAAATAQEKKKNE